MGLNTVAKPNFAYSYPERNPDGKKIKSQRRTADSWGRKKRGHVPRPRHDGDGGELVGGRAATRFCRDTGESHLRVWPLFVSGRRRGGGSAGAFRDKWFHGGEHRMLV